MESQTFQRFCNALRNNDSGVGGSQTASKMDVLANNMANLNNDGFKSDGLVFRGIFPPFEGDTRTPPTSYLFFKLHVFVSQGQDLNIFTEKLTVI